MSSPVFLCFFMDKRDGEYEEAENGPGSTKACAYL